MTTSASAMTTSSGLRLPQSYSKSTKPTVVTSMNNNHHHDKLSTPSSPSFSSRLPHINNSNTVSSPLDNNINNNNINSNNNNNNNNSNVNGGSGLRSPQIRRQSVIGNIPVPNKSTVPLPTSNNNNNNSNNNNTSNNNNISINSVNRRPIRQRTMSDASRIDTSNLPTRSNLARDRQRSDLRRSLYLEHDDSVKSMLSSIKSHNNGNSNHNIKDLLNNNEEDDEDEEDDKPQRYRVSAPLLNSYGIPKMKTRASMGALKYSSTNSNTSSISSTNQQQFSSSSITSSPPSLPPSDLNQKIRVCVRKRPLNKKEIEKGEKDISPLISSRTLNINEPKLKLDLTPYIEQHTFTFDDVFDWNTPNQKVYERTALPLVKYIFEGGKATCFAYGQTGSGKTFTMLDPEHGLYIMAAHDIFALLRQPEHQHLTAWIGLYEIYQGQLYDLLNERKKLFAREDGRQNVVISGLKEYPIDNVDKLIRVFDYGSQIRSTGATGANDSSSRSHAVMQILLKPKKNKKKIHGKLSFIDLAGSERGADRGESDTKTRMEGAEINKSLLALKECIRALDQDKKHTPFRQSKLTQVLKDSFVGKSRTCMIATVSPNGSNSEHSLNTLRYANRVKELKGDRDKRALLENSVSSGSNGDNDNNGYFNGDDEEEDYYNGLPDDSYDDSQDDSDIFDEDTYKLGEENIFDVDFPHEQDELIHSSTFPSTTPATTGIDSKHLSSDYSAISPKMDPLMQRQSSSSSSRYDMDDLSLTNPKYERWSQPPMSPSRTYTTTSMTSNNNNDNNNNGHLTRSSSGIITDGNLSSPVVLSSLTNKHHRSPSLTMDTSLDNLQQQLSSSRRMPVSPSSVTTPTSTSRLSFSSTATNPGQNNMNNNNNSNNNNSVLSNLTLDYSDMEEFVKLHRAEIRAVTDYTKKESKLVATMSLHLSSNQDVSDDDENNSMSTAGQYKSNQQFHMYLQSLDDILEEKMASISALRDRINDTMAKMD
ncbi:unnamed protein product [Cunninghamella blakesleeana]